MEYFLDDKFQSQVTTGLYVVLCDSVGGVCASGCMYVCYV